MKKILFIVLAFALTAIFTACEKDKEPDIKIKNISFVDEGNVTIPNYTTNATGQYRIADKELETYKILINLDNEYNHDIIDLKLTSNKPIEINVNGTYLWLENLPFINWNGFNNYNDILTIRALNVDELILTIESVRYGKTEVKTTENNEFTLYLEKATHIEYMYYEDKKYVFKVDKGNNTEVENGYNNFAKTENKKGVIKYTTTFDDIYFNYEYQYDVEIFNKIVYDNYNLTFLIGAKGITDFDLMTYEDDKIKTPQFENKYDYDEKTLAYKYEIRLANYNRVVVNVTIGEETFLYQYTIEK